MASPMSVEDAIEELKKLARDLVDEGLEDSEAVWILTEVRKTVVDIDYARLQGFMKEGLRQQEKKSKFVGILYLTRRILGDLYQTFGLDSPITFLAYPDVFSQFARTLGLFLDTELATEDNRVSYVFGLWTMDYISPGR